MSNTEFTCARDGCDTVAVKTTHNQKYCSPECCRIATNAKIMAKYHERAAIKRGKQRMCKSCNKTKLSRYNTNDYCGACETKMKENSSSRVTLLVSSVSWLT